MSNEITICPQCKGKGWHHAVLRDLSNRQTHGCGIDSIVHCTFPCCRGGKIHKADVDAYEARSRMYGKRVKVCTGDCVRCQKACQEA